MKETKNFVLNNKYNLLLLFLYFVITFIAMLNHELWRDETQVWCLVRDLNFFEAYNAARTEGHPFLWYLIIMPLAKLKLPVETMQITSLLLVWAGAIWFIFKSPFNKFIKTIFLFSAGMIYYMPIVVRNYCLIPIFLFMLAYFYNKRKDKPFVYVILIVLLSQTHVLMLGFCSILAFFFGIEQIYATYKTKNYKLLLPLLILAINFIFLLITFIGSTTSNAIVVNNIMEHHTFTETLTKIAVLYFPFIKFSSIIIYLVGLILLTVLIALFICNKKIFTAFFFSFGFQLYVLNKFWFGGIPYQKIFLIILILAFFLWIIKENQNDLKPANKIFEISVILILLMGLSTSFQEIENEIKYNFSGAKEIANYIKKNLNNENTFTLIAPRYTISPLSAYLPDKNFYEYRFKQYVTYYDFSGKKYMKTTPPPKTNYIIIQDNYELKEIDGFEPIYKSNPISFGTPIDKEVYSIHKTTIQL